VVLRRFGRLRRRRSQVGAVPRSPPRREGHVRLDDPLVLPRERRRELAAERREVRRQRPRAASGEVGAHLLAEALENRLVVQAAQDPAPPGSRRRGGSPPGSFRRSGERRWRARTPRRRRTSGPRRPCYAPAMRPGRLLATLLVAIASPALAGDAPPADPYDKV